MRLPLLFLLPLSAAALAGCAVDHEGLGQLGSDCVSNDDCLLEGSCFVTDCVGGRCMPAGDTCAANETCNGTDCVPTVSCNASECDAELGSTLLCREGICAEDGTCTTRNLCEAGMECCGGECMRCETDDPCMVANCDAELGCVIEPRRAGVGCDLNGDFCDGVGTCNDSGECCDANGLCNPSNPEDFADPCEGGVENCDEELNRCVGCITNDGCPPIVETPRCDGRFAPNDGQCVIDLTETVTPRMCNAGLCVNEESFQRPFECRREGTDGACSAPTSRTVGCNFSGAETCVEVIPSAQRIDRIFACTGAGNCEGTDIVDDTFVCDRETDAISCGATEPGTCNYEGFCDETASRTQTTFACADASCTPSPMTIACTRNRDGMDCGTPTSTPWSACMVDPENPCRRIETRDVTTGTCGGDNCVTNTVTETRPCGPSTNGDTCAAPTDPPWGACAPDPGNECRLVELRTVMVGMCMDETCTMVPVDEERDCTTDDTDGDPCGMLANPACQAPSPLNGTCEGTRRVNRCDSGACVPVDEACELPMGTVCDETVFGQCRPTGSNQCGMGMRSRQMFRCNNDGGVCGSRAETMQTCTVPDDTPCGDESACIADGDGVCSGGACTQSDVCSVCDPDCASGEMCACGTVNAGGASRAGCTCVPN
ncbi:MAG: hypothetical protein AAF645_05205 [Myxococcota bacterium]